MDFEMHYTAEQQEFRQEVRDWLEANYRKDFRVPVDSSNLTREQYDYGREVRKKVGAKGWLAPLYPKEYGGGGLPVEKAVIISEEFAEREVYMGPDFILSLGAPAIAVWGTEDQKQRFLPPILTGRDVGWQCFTEPEAGTDLASLRMKAEKDGDFYILNGTKTFIGASYDVEWLYTLAITDPNRPRHANLGAFFLPSNLPGITISPMHVIVDTVKNTIFYDNVKVHKDYLIGGETDGWRVAQSTLEVEHGGTGGVTRGDRQLERLIRYCREANRNGLPLSKDPDVRKAIVEYYINTQIGRLFNMRNYWMRTSKVQWAWEGSQAALWGKTKGPQNARQVLDALGPYALINDPKWQAMNGHFEHQQRSSILTHPGGTPEAQKIVMARRIGIARTKQQAAAIV